MSVVDDFVDVVETRLNTVSGVASVIVPTRKGGDATPDKTIVVDVQSVSDLPEYDRPGNPPAKGQLLPIRVSCVVKPSELTVTKKFHEAAAEFGSLAQTSITSVADWHTFGGNSIDAEIGSLELNEPDGEQPGTADFQIKIKYRVNETNFETLRA